MNTYLAVRDYEDGHQRYQLIHAEERELETLHSRWTRILEIEDIHAGVRALVGTLLQQEIIV
jgi:hypothetical protein